MLYPNLPLDRVADFLRPGLQHLCVAALDQEPRFWFGAGIAQQHAATVHFHFRFRLLDELEDIVELLERFLFPHYDIGDELGEASPAFRKLAEWLAAGAQACGQDSSAALGKPQSEI